MTSPQGISGAGGHRIAEEDPRLLERRHPEIQPFWDPVYSALPAIALLDLANEFASHSNAARWRNAVRLYLDGVRHPDERALGVRHFAAC